MAENTVLTDYPDGWEKAKELIIPQGKTPEEREAAFWAYVVSISN